jgi:hypothetical protein
MGNRKIIKWSPDNGEILDWYRLTPAERFQEFLKLWEAYILLGGDLGPEPDSQSPFCFFEASS